MPWPCCPGMVREAISRSTVLRWKDLSATERGKEAERQEPGTWHSRLQKSDKVHIDNSLSGCFRACTLVAAGIPY